MSEEIQIRHDRDHYYGGDLTLDIKHSGALLKWTAFEGGEVAIEIRNNEFDAVIDALKKHKKEGYRYTGERGKNE